jgi:FKBP-type peptidyl-prolyl cis-trans isomerase FkpA
MKQILYTLLFLSVFSIFSCKKDTLQLTIKQYDGNQIANYIAANHLTGFLPSQDSLGVDTSGIYYRIDTAGNPSEPLSYPSHIAMVYWLRTFDGTYKSDDTIANHYYDYLGHVVNANLPAGLQLAIKNDLRFNGGSMDVLIPSHLAYGKYGTGQGSSQVANNRIAGNECLHYHVRLIDDFGKYDDGSIVKYAADSSLNIKGYTRVESVLDTPNVANSNLHQQHFYYYKVLTPGGSSDPITDNSTVTVTYTAQIFNATIVDQFNTTGGTPLFVGGLTQGVKEAFESSGASLNTKISMLIPSYLAYGTASQTGIPAFSCLRFTFVIDALTIPTP